MNNESIEELIERIENTDPVEIAGEILALQGMITASKQKQIMPLGKPTHYRPSNENVSACGIVSPEYSGYDARSCDCIRCMKTKKYKVYMGKK